MAEATYQSALADEAPDLVAQARAGELGEIWHRDAEVAKVIDHLDARASVLVTGPVGAGKTAVLHGVAHALAARPGKATPIRQLSTGQVMAGTRFLGEWQTKVTRILEAAVKEGAVLFFTDIWNLVTVGKTSNDPSALIDVVAPFVEDGRVRLLGEASAEMLQVLGRSPRLAGLLRPVAVAPLSAEHVLDVLERAARRDGVMMGLEARQALVRTTSRFSPARPQPGPALALHRQVRDYHAQRRAAGDVAAIDRTFVEEVFSLYTGLPRFVVSHAETIPAHRIRAWFEDRLVGQREAIEAMVESIALFKAGLNDPDRPIGSFLFVGPTGVGKTELARLLATFLFGSATRMLRFDLSEFKDYHSFEMLVGSPGNPARPARLVDPVRAQPFQVVLFDELEKAHANVWDLFLQLLDEGQLTAASGQVVSFRNTMIIATSNVGASESSKGLGFGAASPGDDARALAIRTALERQFRPEFLNRFQHVVVFHPLSIDEVRTIARHEMTEILVREGITSRNLVVDVGDAALDLVIGRAFDPRYGARALKRELQRQLVLPIAMTLMERRVDPGSVLTVGVKGGEVRVRVVETGDSRAARKAAEPIRDPDGKVLTREEMVAGLDAMRPEIDAISAAVDEPFLRAERHRLLEMRRDPEFWNHADEAAMTIRDLDRYTAWLGRLDRLRERADDIGAALGEAEMRRELTDLANRYRQLEGAIAVTRREMVTMGKDGVWDALVEVRPLGARGRSARDLLVRAYLGWAEHRRYEVTLLREPAADDEPAMVAVLGHHAHGFLAAERGLHKLRTEQGDSVASVRTAPWTDRRDAARFTVHRALKTTGQLDGALRSRLECEGGLVLQNGKTLTENRELAGELIMSWSRAPAPPEDIVRRYDLDPFMVRDVATGFSSGRGDALSPRNLHALLCLRVDELAPHGA